MKACFLEEGKMGNSSAAAKIHIKPDHMHIHREFYIDGGVSCLVNLSNFLPISMFLFVPTI